MSAYIISYDLNKPGQGYSALYKKIEALGRSWHCLDSTWIVVHPGPCTAIRDALLPVIDSSDALLVAKLSGEAAWHGFGADCANWLKNNL